MCSRDIISFPAAAEVRQEIAGETFFWLTLLFSWLKHTVNYTYIYLPHLPGPSHTSLNVIIASTAAGLISDVSASHLSRPGQYESQLREI